MLHFYCRNYFDTLHIMRSLIGRGITPEQKVVAWRDDLDVILRICMVDSTSGRA